ncbi:twin-arginine translocation signal domain-containing protein [Chloroflexi bacterium TSY]|nr:twin-arginine translocation signal domain-containing protein [Chloroflexi bacterium TSY]
MKLQGHTLSRRTFLKASGLSLAAAGLVACVPPVPAPAESAPSQPAESLNVLVVGDPFQFALELVNADFTEETGIAVNFESLSYDALNARLSRSKFQV